MNIPYLCFINSKASKPEKALDGGRNRGGELRHKRMSETDMTLHEKAHTDMRLKDSKSCNDLKVSPASHTYIKRMAMIMTDIIKLFV